MWMVETTEEIVIGMAGDGAKAGTEIIVMVGMVTVRETGIVTERVVEAMEAAAAAVVVVGVIIEIIGIVETDTETGTGTRIEAIVIETVVTNIEEVTGELLSLVKLSLYRVCMYVCMYV